MIDIVITHYRESWETCRKLFVMLDLQRCIDWRDVRVTVINDGWHRLPEDRLAELSFQVEQVDIPHGGISAARNAGIDHATEPWIMFCDCDDTFVNIYALRDILHVLNPQMEADIDMLWCTNCEENGLDGANLLYLTPKQKIFVFCHGKVYRRQFLLDAGIRFDESLTFNEDSCFNATIIARTPHTRIGQVKTFAPVYVRVLRESSVTTSDGAKDKGAYCQFRRNLTITEENRLHRSEENYCGMITRTAYDAYYMLFGRKLTLPCKRRIFDEFLPWITERAERFGKVSAEVLDQIRDVSRSELLEFGEEIPDSHEHIAAWIHKITKGELL